MCTDDNNKKSSPENNIQGRMQTTASLASAVVENIYLQKDSGLLLSADDSIP